MDVTLTDKVVIARKHYSCDASEQWRDAGYSVADCETSEQRRSVEAAEADGWQILPGQAYRKAISIQDGKFCTYRARLDMHEVCIDLGMWDE